MADTIGSLDDCLATFQDLHRFCKPETRLIVSYYTRLWDPLLLLYSKLAAGHRFVRRNWLTNQDIANLLQLADFEVVKREWRMLVPFRIVRARSADQPLRRHAAADPQALHAQLRGGAAAPAAARETAIGFGRGPLPQRARQYRSRRAANSALLPGH